MPNYFTLTRKSSPDAGPVAFSAIDEEMCAALGVPCDPVKYYLDWYDLLGVALACGKSFAQIRQAMVEYEPPAGDVEGAAYYARHVAVVDYLEANYTPDSWAQIGR